MVRRDEDDRIRMPQGPAPIQKAYNDTDYDSDSASSNDCEGIRMPDGPPPPRAPTGPRASVIQPLPGQPPLPREAPSLPGAPGAHFARPPPMYYQGSTSLPNQYEPYSSPRDHNSTRTSHPLPSRPPPSTSQAIVPPGPPPGKPTTVISAEPVLRDLKKESTAFVPTAIRKKQAAEKAKAAKGGLPGSVNAAPGAIRDRGTEEERSELITSLQSQIEQRAGSNNKEDGQDDYQKFLGNVQDLL
ncbi:uncharacterized protein FA14DRAFT_160787 [Meira miltonrushii]|uniref:Uncharacterized protein n=1 Tax=Meira miltonrushii TaxID=1280837 RepID=A0A316VDM3_9BASI|nr:uncharacterized protein FA14DRAFT_160787 [Meira miltonrushii]PWN35777.1 hypothetical protein FA14DRAFT_160787 [Meira miltonrushii]